MAELVVLSGARAGAVFELPDMPTVVGRSPEAHFQLDDPWISSMHAMFERRGADIWVVDLESRNGTFVGGERVQEAVLRPGCVLRFGRTDVRLEQREARNRPQPGRNPTPPSIPVSRPTSRLDAPEITGPNRVLPDTRVLPDPLPLAARGVVLLRMALHLAAPGVAPDPDSVGAAAGVLRRSVLAEGGLVRLAPSGALAVFGAEAPSADDADFALRAARTARDDLERLGGGLMLRAAVDGGPAVVGNVTGPEGFDLAVLGELAERLEGLLTVAGPGEIVVGPGAAGASGLGPVRKTSIGGAEIAVARAR